MFPRYNVHKKCQGRQDAQLNIMLKLHKYVKEKEKKSTIQHRSL